jgi:U3 small nucleolar RNA-associated protein 10
MLITSLGKLQFLEADLSRYLAALVSQRDHFVGSASYSITFHAEHLTKARGESKRDAGYKQRVLCWLLTHVVAAPVPALQAGILASMRHVSSMVKLQTLSDLLVSILDLDKAKLEATYGVDCDGFISDLVGCFDSSVSSLLKDEDGTAWSLFVRTFTKSIRPGKVAYFSKQCVHSSSHRIRFFCCAKDHICC